MQQSGGLLLTPVRKLVATLIFAPQGKNANQVLSSAPKILIRKNGDFYFFTLHFSLKPHSGFLEAIANGE